MNIIVINLLKKQPLRKVSQQAGHRNFNSLHRCTFVRVFSQQCHLKEPFKYSQAHQVAYFYLKSQALFHSKNLNFSPATSLNNRLPTRGRCGA